MRSNQERLNNIYKKVAICKKEKAKNIIKLYSFASIVFCISIIFTGVETNIKDDSEKVEGGIFNWPEKNPKIHILTDSMPSIVYYGNIYTFDGDIKCDVIIKESLLGDYLGSASGTMSIKDESKNVFASIVAMGEVYSVNGYDKEFRICIYDEENSYIVFYDNLDEDNLVTGNDLYGKLFLKNNYVDVLYQLHDDYMNMQDNYKECSQLNQSDIDEFIDSLYKSPFVTITAEEEIDKIPNYDTEGDKIAHLYFKMNDETTIAITLYENGYVHYRDMGRVHSYIGAKIFDKVFQAITSD